jgi:hypothetical protein
VLSVVTRFASCDEVEQRHKGTRHIDIDQTHANKQPASPNIHAHTHAPRSRPPCTGPWRPPRSAPRSGTAPRSAWWRCAAAGQPWRSRTAPCVAVPCARACGRACVNRFMCVCRCGPRMPRRADSRAMGVWGVRLGPARPHREPRPVHHAREVCGPSASGPS